MKKNGEIIQCKVCEKEFYISRSRISFKKYCSRECAFKDNLGFKPKLKKCKICSKDFFILKFIELQKKTCSEDCWRANNYAISKARTSAKAIKICKICLKEYTGLKFHIGTSKCKDCILKKISTQRKGKNNGNYKAGLYINSPKNKYKKQNWIHLAACTKYRKAFFQQHEYLFCEICNVNSNGTQSFQVHHIYAASKMPRHPNLHNFRNLIMVCLDCHHKFHAGKTYEKEFKILQKQRKLIELFGS